MAQKRPGFKKRGQRRGKRYKAYGNKFGPLPGDGHNPRWAELPRPQTLSERSAYQNTRKFFTYYWRGETRFRKT